MKFVTFNIRYDTPNDGNNRFDCRAKFILDKIAREKPDVIGFQECLPHVFDFLREHMTGYYVFGCGRDAVYEGEHNPVAFLKDKYELLGLETQWLSPTPQKPGSRYAVQSDCPRIVTCAMLREYGTSTPFYVFNTHLDHISDEARVQGANHVVGFMKEYISRRELPLVFMGDFNAYPDSEPLKVFMTSDLCLKDTTGNITNSYHGYGKVNEPRIDYIITRGFKQTKETVAWDDKVLDTYLSDHYPLATELEME